MGPFAKIKAQKFKFTVFRLEKAIYKSNQIKQSTDEHEHDHPIGFELLFSHISLSYNHNNPVQVLPIHHDQYRQVS